MRSAKKGWMSYNQRMNQIYKNERYFQVGELIDNGLELLNAGGLSELDLSHIKLLNSLDFITRHR